MFGKWWGDVMGINLGVLKKKLDLATLLELRFEGSNGSQVFTDSSSYNRSVTVSSGSPALSTTNPLSGTSSLLLGTNGTITTPNFTTPVGNTVLKTIQFRIKADLTTLANNASQGIFIKGFSNSFFIDYSHQCILTRNASGNGGKVVLYLYHPNNSSVSTKCEAIVTDLSANNHIAFVDQDNNIIQSYVNGAASGSYFMGRKYQANTYAIDIGVSVYNLATATQTTKFTGWLDNFKLDNTVLYTTSFTPPL